MYWKCGKKFMAALAFYVKDTNINLAVSHIIGVMNKKIKYKLLSE